MRDFEPTYDRSGSCVTSIAGPNGVAQLYLGPPWPTIHHRERPGAAGNVSTEQVVRTAPDGYALLLSVPANAINASLYDNLNFNFIDDIVPVAGVARSAFVMAVTPSVPAKTVPEFIAYAKANPGKINMASFGTGTLSHVSGELFMMMTGVDMLHVPYRGSWMPDLLAGQVQVVFSAMSIVIDNTRAGKLRALAVTSAMRSDALPDVPTLGEFVPGYEATAWFGMGAPKNTPAEIVDKLNSEINAGLADPKLKARLADLVVEPMPMRPVQLGKFIADETEKWGKVIRAARIKAG
jgi:tripartite-type tricarboxylate transporter receptor subunit TctC